MKTFALFFQFLTLTLVLMASPVFAFTSNGEATCTGYWDGDVFWNKSDPTITEYWEWKALDTIEPYIGASDRKDPAKIFGRVTTSQSTSGFGIVGVTANGDVSGPGNFALALGFEWHARGVGFNMFGDVTSKSTTGSESTTTEGSYTLSGTGEVMGVKGAGGITIAGYGLRGSGAITIHTTPTFSAPSALVVTTEQDIPKAYECAHENCEVALPDKHHHRVTCKEKVYFALGSVVKVDCNHKYYKCQTSTCGNDGKHLITHACGHEDEKEDAWKHEMQASCSGSTTRNGSTVYCQSSNFYLCQHENHDWPSGSPSQTPTDNTPNCSGCTSHCSSPCSCSDSGTCNGTVAAPPPEPEPSEPRCANGHPYDPNNTYQDNLHRTRRCRYIECRQEWQKCTTPITPICNKPYRKRNSLRCWAE